jgi:predicted ATP-grasp superfamily ATP-dependent carboligase
MRRIAWPKSELLYGSLGAERELVVGIAIEPHLRWRRYADLLAGLARDLGARRVVLLGAYLADVLYSRPVGITGFASSASLLEMLGVAGSSYEGPTGIVGVLGERFAREGLEVMSLWAALPHYITAQPNPRGALALVQILGRVLDLKLDTAPLERMAAEFEERISALVAADPELAEYVRQLKRREFAQ